MRITKIPLKFMHFDYESNKVSIETAGFSYTNGRGHTWTFQEGWHSDGHSVGRFKHFDTQTFAALCHDQDCERANRLENYALRRIGDKDYKYNLAELGAPKTTVLRRYAAVSAMSRWLKFTGKLS